MNLEAVVAGMSPASSCSHGAERRPSNTRTSRRGVATHVSRQSLSSIETRSRPRSLAASPRGFTFYLGTPGSSIPGFLVS